MPRPGIQLNELLELKYREAQMKISEYIKHLESVRDQVGDVEVQQYDYDGRSEARQPQVGYVLLLRPRERRPRFWSSYEGDDRKGDPICRV